MADLTRRKFVGGVAATTAAVLAAGAVGIGFAFGGSQAVGFGVEHSELVKVRIGNGEVFAVDVIERSTGEVLQSEMILAVDELFLLQSDHVRFYRVQPPGT